MMAREALPCIVCDKPLDNVLGDAENQPHKGTAFQTHGHYGSTIFDPMDGSFIELNVCDDCIRKKAPTHIVCGRRDKPVLCDGTLVGWCKVPGRGLVPFNPEVMGGFDSDDVLQVERDEIGDSDRFPEIVWLGGPRKQ